MWRAALLSALLGPCRGLQPERQPSGARAAARAAGGGASDSGAEYRIVDHVCSEEGAAEVYREPRRPQFHFTPARNYMNDPNGLVYHKGVYHLFFQSNPLANHKGYTAWGHAESSDLLHWEQVPDAIAQDAEGMPYSGSAVVDWHNTSGFHQVGLGPPLIAIYTIAPMAGGPSSQRIAYSHDGGRVWTKVSKDVVPPFGKDPEPGNDARDPLVRWHEPSKRWVMILYFAKGEYQLFGSRDLQNWKYLSSVQFEGAYECPDMFEMPIAGEPAGHTKWVVFAPNGQYVVGEFDGSHFRSEGPVQRLEYGVAYASQTFDEEPLGRRVQISWLQPRKVDTRSGAFRGTGFTGAMAFPAEMELVRLPRSPGGLRLRKRPVPELAKLRLARLPASSRVLLQPGAPLRIEEPAGRAGPEGAGLEIRVRARLPQGEARLAAHPRADPEPRLNLTVRGETIRFSAPEGTVEGAVHVSEWRMPLAFEGGAMEARILADRTTLEIYDLIGGTSLSIYHDLPCDGTEWKRHIEMGARHAGTEIDELDVYRLGSALPSHPPGQQSLHRRLRAFPPELEAGMADWQRVAGNPELFD